MTKDEIEYMKAHPDEPMKPDVFAEAIRLWHERGEPTKKDERKEARKKLHKQYKRKKIEYDPYGMAAQDGT